MTGDATSLRAPEERVNAHDAAVQPGGMLTAGSPVQDSHILCVAG